MSERRQQNQIGGVRKEKHKIFHLRVQSASDIYAEAISREQDITNQLLKGPYAAVVLLIFRSSRLGANKAMAGMFVYYISADICEIISDSVQPSRGRCRRRTEYHRRLRHRDNSKDV